MKELLANEVKIFHPFLKLKQSTVLWVPRACCELTAGTVHGSPVPPASSEFDCPGNGICAQPWATLGSQHGAQGAERSIPSQ